MVEDMSSVLVQNDPNRIVEGAENILNTGFCQVQFLVTWAGKFAERIVKALATT